jgi:hypothetical protein
MGAPAIDASSASAADNTVDFNWTHTPSGTPTALFVFVANDATQTDIVVDVTYNSVSLTEHASSPFCSATGGVRCLHVWYTFSPPSGAQTVAVDINSAQSTSACAYTFTGTGLQIQNVENLSGDAANPSGTLTLSSTTSAVVLGGISGLNIPTNVTAATGWTQDHALDNGASSVVCHSYDTVGSSDVTTGWTSASDYYEILSVGLSESSTSTSNAIFRRRR